MLIIGNIKEGHEAIESIVGGVFSAETSMGYHQAKRLAVETEDADLDQPYIWAPVASWGCLWPTLGSMAQVMLCLLHLHTAAQLVVALAHA